MIGTPTGTVLVSFPLSEHVEKCEMIGLGYKELLTCSISSALSRTIEHFGYLCWCSSGFIVIE